MSGKKIGNGLCNPTFSFIVITCWSCGAKYLMVYRNVRSEEVQYLFFVGNYYV